MTKYKRPDVIWFPGFYIKPERTYTEREVSEIVAARVSDTRRELVGRITVLESDLRRSQTLNQTIQLREEHPKKPERRLYIDIGEEDDD